MISKTTLFKKKYPKLSEYKDRYSIGILFVMLLLAIINFANYKFQTLNDLIKNISLYVILYLAFTLCCKIYEINALIKKIEDLFKSNLKLSKEIADNSGQLLLCDADYTVQRKKEKSFFLFFTIALIIFYIIMLKFKSRNIYFFYSGWVLMLTFTMSFFFSMRNIFYFFFEVNNSCCQLMSKINNNTITTLGGQLIFSPRQFKDKWNKCLLIISLVIFLSIIVSFIFLDFRDATRAISILIVLVILRILMLDIENIVKLNLKVLGDYDENSKA